MQPINIENKNSKDTIAIGIDFGTTNSLLCTIESEEVNVLKINDESTILPSLFYFFEDGSIKFENNFNDNLSQEYIRLGSIKRLLGRSLQYVIENKEAFADVIDILKEQEGHLYVKVYNKSYSIINLVAVFLSNMKETAEKIIQHDITKCVLSIPAYFDNNAKGAIMQAANIANLNIIRLISEPTAAAYAYKISNKQNGKYLVYDFGGGTFDASLINICDTVLKVEAVTGDNLLGGKDIDYAISQSIKLKKHDISDDDSLSIAKNIKEQIKISKDINYYCKHLDTNFYFSFEQLFELVNPIIQKTVRLVKKMLIEQEVNKIDGILLVGGSSKCVLVSQILKQEFAYPLLSEEVNMDEIVAVGSAYQASSILHHNKSDLLIDVTSLSVGIELADGLVDVIIPRNTIFPTQGKTMFTTTVDNQAGILFHVVQGEREFAKYCISLGKFELTNLPPERAGLVKIEVKFSLDISGVLTISAMEMNSGVYQDITVHPNRNLTQDEISRMLEDGEKNIEQDYKKRELQVAVSHAKQLIYNTKQTLGSYRDIEIVNQKILELERVINGCSNINEVNEAKKSFENFITTIIGNYIKEE